MKKVKLTLTAFLFTVSLSAHPGIGIVMDSKGNVFYTDLVHVWKISTEGDKSIAVENVHTHALYIDENDNLYGEHVWYNGEQEDTWGNFVWCLGWDGELEITVPAVEGFLDNNTLTRDPDNYSYWVQSSDSDQVLFKSLDEDSHQKVTDYSFKDIRWKHYSTHHNCLYIVDQISLIKVDQMGKSKILIDNLKQSGSIFQRVADRHYVFGIWTDAKDTFAALYGAKKVIKISTNGQYETIYESKRGWSPCGGLSAEDGSLWIMEFSRSNKTRIVHLKDSKVQKVY